MFEVYAQAGGAADAFVPEMVAQYKSMPAPTELLYRIVYETVEV